MQKVMVSVTIMFLMSESMSCTSLADSSPIPMERKIFEIDRDCSGFIRYYKSCKRKFLGACFKYEQKIEKIEAEFKDKELCKTLIDKEFILRLRHYPI